MFKTKLSAAIAVLAMAVFAAPALADASDSHHGGPAPAPAPAPGPQGQGHGNVVRFKPGLNADMPPKGFHGTPPTFHGQLPNVKSPHPSPLQVHEPGHPGHDLGKFQGHDFAHFSKSEMDNWHHGEWRHTRHHGHYGWWWWVNGFWFFYPEPIYPFPTYIGSDYWYDYYDEYGAPSYYWYYCEDPPGYYPYVQECNGPWEAVPPTPDQ